MNRKKKRVIFGGDVRQRTLRKLLALKWDLETDYHHKGKIYRSWLKRVSPNVHIGFKNFVWELKDEDIQSILKCSKRTASDYRFTLRKMIGY